MVVGPCPLGNMTSSEVTETYGLFDKTVMLAGRLAKSKKSGFANQICLSVRATAWLVVVGVRPGTPTTGSGHVGQPLWGTSRE